MSREFRSLWLCLLMLIGSGISRASLFLGDATFSGAVNSFANCPVSIADGLAIANTGDGFRVSGELSFDVTAATNGFCRVTYTALRAFAEPVGTEMQVLSTLTGTVDVGGAVDIGFMTLTTRIPTASPVNCVSSVGSQLYGVSQPGGLGTSLAIGASPIQTINPCTLAPDSQLDAQFVFDFITTGPASFALHLPASALSEGTIAPASEVPEPASLGLLLVAGMVAAVGVAVRCRQGRRIPTSQSAQIEP